MYHSYLYIAPPSQKWRRHHANTGVRLHGLCRRVYQYRSRFARTRLNITTIIIMQKITNRIIAPGCSAQTESHNAHTHMRYSTHTHAHTTFNRCSMF
jgi:hypothetical protein